MNMQTQAITRMGGFAIALLAVLAVAFFATTADAQTDARVRVLHGSPDAPAVDVYVDGTKAVENLSFSSITDYVTLPAGAHNVKVFANPSDGTGTPVIEEDLTLEAGKDYTVAAANVLASISLEVYVDNNAAPAAGQGHVRVVHLSPDAGPVDIFAEGAGVVVPNLAFPNAADYLPLDAATYNLEVRAAGTDTVAFDIGAVPIEAGKVYSAFALGLADGTPALTVKLTVDATAQAATSTPAPAATAAPGELPTSGGPLGNESNGLPAWAIAGMVIALIGAAMTSVAAVRIRADR